jgi:hypothetical protein
MCGNLFLSPALVWRRQLNSRFHGGAHLTTSPSSRLHLSSGPLSCEPRERPLRMPCRSDSSSMAGAASSCPFPPQEPAKWACLDGLPSRFQMARLIVRWRPTSRSLQASCQILEQSQSRPSLRPMGRRQSTQELDLVLRDFRPKQALRQPFPVHNRLRKPLLRKQPPSRDSGPGREDIRKSR